MASAYAGGVLLGELIETLRKEDPNIKLKIGFGNPHSYRGYYSELGVEPIENVSVGEMADALESSLGETFQGWKGGDFTMGVGTEVFLAEEGCCGEIITPLALRYLLSRENRID